MFSSRWRKGRKEEGGRDEGTVFFVGRRRSQEVTRPAPKEERTDGFGVRLREIPLPVPPRVRRPLPSDARDNYLLSGCGSSIGRRRRRCPEGSHTEPERPMLGSGRGWKSGRTEPALKHELNGATLSDNHFNKVKSVM